MEPKVVQRCLKDSGEASGETKWRYSAKCAHYRQSGSGNNWALGYGSYAQEKDAAHAKLQSLLEQIDFFGGFQVYQSLAGGTGSGLGANVVESLRDEVSAKAPMINVAIWPYSTGEVILQNYNVLLTLKSLLTNSDGIIPLYNDDVLSACR